MNILRIQLELPVESQPTIRVVRKSGGRFIAYVPVNHAELSTLNLERTIELWTKQNERERLVHRPNKTTDEEDSSDQYGRDKHHWMDSSCIIKPLLKD